MTKMELSEQMLAYEFFFLSNMESPPFADTFSSKLSTSVHIDKLQYIFISELTRFWSFVISVWPSSQKVFHCI